MTVLDTLTLALGIDSKGIDVGLADAQRKIDQGARSLANSLLSPFKAALGSLIAGFSLAAITRQYLQQADAIGKLSESIGADMEDLQAWGEAAKRAGGSAEAFQGTVQSLTRNLQQAATNAKGPAAQALAELGIKATDATGKARDSFEVLRDLAGVMEGMDKQKAVALGQKVGIDRGTIMLLQSGRAAVDDLIAREKELGGYTKEDAEIAAKANRAIADFGQALKAASADIMRHIAPAITWVAEHLTALVKDFRQHKAFYLSAIGAISVLLGAKLIPQLLKISGIAKYINVPFAILSTIITGLALVFEDLWVYMNGGKSAFEDWWKELGTGPELLDKFNKAWENTKKTVDNVLKAVQKLFWDTIAYLVSKFDYFYEIFGGLWDIIEGLFSFDFEQIGRGLGRAFQGAWGLIQSIFKDIFSGMEKMSVWDMVKDGAKKAWDAIKKLALGFFKSLPTEAQEWITKAWNTITGTFDWKKIGQSFSAAMSSAIDYVSGLFNSLFGEASKFDWWGAVTDTAKAVWDAAKSIATSTWEAIKQFAIGAFGELPKSIPEMFTTLFDKIYSIFNWRKIGTALAQAFFSAASTVSEILDSLFSEASKIDWWGVVVSTAEGAWEIAKSLARNAWKAIKDIALGFFEGLPKDAQDKLVRLWEAVKGVFHWDDIKAIFDWESIKISAIEKFTNLWNDVKKIFSWEEWKKSAITSFGTLKDEFLKIFDIDFDFKKLVTALENAFNEAWNWVLEHIPFVKWFIEKGGMAAEAVKETVQGVSKATEKAMEAAGVEDPEALAEASARDYTQPTPADGVSSQAAAAVTNNETTNYDVKQDDNRTFNFNFTGVTDDPDGFFKMVKGPLSKNPGWMSQSASTMQFGGAS